MTFALSSILIFRSYQTSYYKATFLWYAFVIENTNVTKNTLFEKSSTDLSDTRRMPISLHAYYVRRAVNRQPGDRSETRRVEDSLISFYLHVKFITKYHCCHVVFENWAALKRQLFIMILFYIFHDKLNLYQATFFTHFGTVIYNAIKTSFL